jgi:hypothetical protein
MKKYYLAHPYGARQWVREWELKIERDLGIEVINPFYDRQAEQIAALDRLKTVSTTSLQKYTDGLNEFEIVGDDLGQITKADGIIAILTDEVAIGTPMEIFFSAFVAKHPTFVICLYKPFQNHPWIKALATKRFNTVEEFEEFAKTGLKSTPWKSAAWTAIQTILNRSGNQ